MKAQKFIDNATTALALLREASGIIGELYMSQGKKTRDVLVTADEQLQDVIAAVDLAIEAARNREHTP